jgi:polyribonucleotide nucleotidyltransferase
LLRTKIDPEKIGALIGPGGKNIRGIQEDTGAVIEVEDDGTVTIASANAESAQEALMRVEMVTASVQIGRIYDGRVSSVKDFGVFVEIMPGKDGLCHISELSDEYVQRVSDVCRVGDRMKVKVIAVDEQDRVKLSRRAAMEELGEEVKMQPHPDAGTPMEDDGGGSRGGRSNGDRGRGRGERSGGGRGRGGDRFDR